MKYLLVLMFLVGCSPKFKIGDCIIRVDKDYNPPVAIGRTFGRIVSIRSSFFGLAVDYLVKNDIYVELLSIGQSEAMECPK